MPPCRLSAAIVTFRSDARLLEATLRSLAFAIVRARGAGFLSEASIFVIANDGAPRAVRDALSAWPPSAGLLTLVQGHGNIGYGAANNLVLDRIASDYHLVLNPDVEMYPDTLCAALGTMQAHPEAGLVAPAVFDAAGERQYLCRRYPSAWILFLRGFGPAFLRRRYAASLHHYEMRDLIGDRFVSGIPLACGCFMFMRTQLFRNVGGFDPRFFLYFEDYDISLRLGRSAQVAYAPDVRIIHHGGEAARKGWPHIAWFVRSALLFYRLHGWKSRGGGH